MLQLQQLNPTTWSNQAGTAHHSPHTAALIVQSLTISNAVNVLLHVYEASGLVAREGKGVGGGSNPSTEKGVHFYCLVIEQKQWLGP